MYKFRHGHDCMDRKYDHAEERTKKLESYDKYLQLIGWKHVVMRECEWKEEKKQNLEIRQFLKTYVRVPNAWRQQMSQAKLLHLVKNGQLYGCGTFDLSVPQHLRKEFEEFGPFIYNRNIEFKVILAMHNSL